MPLMMYFRCSPKDRSLIEANAARTGFALSTYMRLQCTGKPIMRAYRHIRADWKELQRCMGAINRAGNVVNQLVRLLRGGGGDRELADMALAELCRAARRIIALLGKG